MTDYNSCPGVQCDGDVLEGYQEDASGLVGTPDGVVRIRDPKEVSEVMEWAWKNHAPITPVGGRTSTTGSASPTEGGLIVSLEGLKGVEFTGESTVRVGAGMYLGDLKRQLAQEGWLYPPDPTSENDCTLGGSVATNASGPRSLKYGPTRSYVCGLDVVLPNGESRSYSRRKLKKDTTGYGAFAEPVDWFIGSEGTLGIVTSVELQLVPSPHGVMSFFVYFPDVDSALDGVLWLQGEQGQHPRPDGPWEKIEARCIELFDGEALEVIRAKASNVGVQVPEEAGSMLFIEQEVGPDEEELLLESWFEILMVMTPLGEAVTVAENASRQRALRDLRHHVPATLNEEARGYREFGGRKVSTDWAVPLSSLHEAVRRGTELALGAQVPRMIRYGHIGNGHPHFNLIARDSSELARASDTAKLMAKMACSLGGTAAAEHGLGKVKREFLEWVHPPEVVQLMRLVKAQMDPRGLMAPGNLFPYER